MGIKIKPLFQKQTPETVHRWIKQKMNWLERTVVVTEISSSLDNRGQAWAGSTAGESKEQLTWTPSHRAHSLSHRPLSLVLPPRPGQGGWEGKANDRNLEIRDTETPTDKEQLEKSRNVKRGWNPSQKNFGKKKCKWSTSKVSEVKSDKHRRLWVCLWSE